MPQPLAVCDNGHFFQSGIGFDAGGTGVEVTLEVQSAPRICPECGANARVLGGSYQIIEDSIELLQGPERTVEELDRLARILREAQETGASPEEVRNQLWCLSGVGPAIAEMLVPTTPADFYALLAVILVAIQMIISAKQKGQNAPVQLTQVINNITVQAPPPNPAYGERVGRNVPCPCHSGTKFKRCHGRNGETRYYGP